MVEINASVANLKHQYRVCQYAEHDCCAYNKKYAYYYKYPRSTPFAEEH